MAQTTILPLLSHKDYPGPVGTPVTLVGDPQPAGSYHLANRDLQTITWFWTPNMQANIKIQATLVKEPLETDWFDVYNIPANQANGFYNLMGNFVWIRAKATEWFSGCFNLINLSY